MENLEYYPARYAGLNIFQEAKLKEADGFGYRARRFMTVWNSKIVSWNWIGIDYGIRWSDKNQYFPVWNTSHNNQRSLMLGAGKLYFEIIYHRKNSFNQDRKFILRKTLWKFYQLIS